jgi:hypothetical protein
MDARTALTDDHHSDRGKEPRMGRCLIVANQTLGGEALDGAVRDCISRDVTVFHVVVPMTKVEHETSTWTGGFGALEHHPNPEAVRAAQQDAARHHEAELREARARAQHRLDQMLDKIQSAGGQAEGEVGFEDPVEAAKAVLNKHAAFDEIIVSTLPARLSRWVKMDVPSRISRMTDVPVTTVEARE